MREMRTERLLLRPFTVDDAPDCYREIYSDLDVVEHYSHLRFAGVAEVRDHIAGHVRAWAGQLGRHAVVRLTDGAFAGQVHLNPYVNADRWSGEPARPVNTVEVDGQPDGEYVVTVLDHPLTSGKVLA